MNSQIRCPNIKRNFRVKKAGIDGWTGAGVTGFKGSGVSGGRAEGGHKVSDYDQDIPQSYTADQLLVQCGRATEH